MDHVLCAFDSNEELVEFIKKAAEDGDDFQLIPAYIDEHDDQWFWLISSCPKLLGR